MSDYCLSPTPPDSRNVADPPSSAISNENPPRRMRTDSERHRQVRLKSPIRVRDANADFHAANQTLIGSGGRHPERRSTVADVPWRSVLDCLRETASGGRRVDYAAPGRPLTSAVIRRSARWGW